MKGKLPSILEVTFEDGNYSKILDSWIEGFEKEVVTVMEIFFWRKIQELVSLGEIHEID